MLKSITSDPTGIAVIREQFDQWSGVYDDHPNPMLSLEQRVLEPMLTCVRNRSVADIGCGTGRWLAKLPKYSPRRTFGFDISAGMLRRATRIAGPGLIALADCTSLPLPDRSIDVAIASFVFSHIKDIKQAVGELWRILRPGGEVFLTDLHPDTCAAEGWRRSFRAMDGESVDLVTHHRGIEELRGDFLRAAFEFRLLVEPEFGPPELDVLQRAGMGKVFDQIRGRPPIFLLSFCKPGMTSRPTHSSARKDARLLIGNCTVATSSSKLVQASIELDDTHIRRISQAAVRHPDIDLDGYLLLPGLINAHDHLDFGLFPRLGLGPYRNASQWAADIHHCFAEIIALHRTIPKSSRLWWGAIRNLLAGVTTVCHHNPYEFEFDDAEFPVRVVRDFGWAHSLAFERDVAEKFQVTPEDIPFIIHAAEGVDSGSENELSRLDRLGSVRPNTVLVHGLALNQQGIALLNSRGAALILCPSSARFLFGRSQSAEFVRFARRTALGTDSPLTACGDLLDEIRFAHQEVGLSADEIYFQVTSSSADTLMLKDGQGGIAAETLADMIAIKNRGISPAEALANSSFRDIELVLLGGRVQLVSPALHERLPHELTSALESLEVDGVVRWVRAPVSRLLREAQSILGEIILLSGKRVSDAVSN